MLTLKKQPRRQHLAEYARVARHIKGINFKSLKIGNLSFLDSEEAIKQDN